MPHALSSLNLGEAANLLHGLHAEWFGAARSVSPFCSPPHQPFTTFDLNAPPDSVAEWSGPTLSLHDDVAALIDALFAYRVLPFSADSSGFHVPASALMLTPENRAATLAALSARLGLDLASAETGGFLLLKMQRVDADLMHEAVRGGVGQYIRLSNYWTREGRHAMGRLRVTERIVDGDRREAVVTARHAQRYLEYFHDFGTHFVSRVGLGDTILQVFAIKPARSAQLRELFQREAGSACASGPLAHGLRFCVGPLWTSARGRIVSASGDPALARSVAAGEWRDAEFAQGDYLLAPLAKTKSLRASRDFFARFSQAVPISVELKPQSSFMENFRADAWARLLKGAMLQRFGPPIQIAPTAAAAAIFPDIIQYARAFPDHSTPTADALAAFRLLAEFGRSPVVRWRGRRVSILAYRAIANSATGATPAVLLDDEAFDHFEFVAGQMRGAFFVLNERGDRRETICDGFRFATVSDAENQPRLVLRGDVGSPSTEMLGHLANQIESSLEFAEAMLMHPPSAAFARDFLEWLVSITNREDAPQALHDRVVALSQPAHNR